MPLYSNLNEARCISFTRLSPAQVVTSAAIPKSKVPDQDTQFTPKTSIKISPRTSSLLYKNYHVQDNMNAMLDTIENSSDDLMNSSTAVPGISSPSPAMVQAPIAYSSYRKMPPSPPLDNDLNLGDVVDVPGMMYGTIRYIGSIKKKNGIFVGVELNKEFSSRGKNSGDVDGVTYFTPEIPGSGIFLPLGRANRRKLEPVSKPPSLPISPTTPKIVHTKSSNKVTNIHTPTKLSASKININLRSTSPMTLSTSRVSLPRSESPVRKLHATTKLSLPSLHSKTPSKYGHQPSKKLAQSVRGIQDSRDPTKNSILSPRHGIKTGIANRSASALSNSTCTQNERVSTPRPYLASQNRKRLDSLSSTSDKISSKELNNEIILLRAQIDKRDQQLQEQAISLAEMEKALAEVQNLMEIDAVNRTNKSSTDDRDIFQLRAMLKEKNERISNLTAEFDAHRADFRSTIDTLELASTETERVYEQRLDEMLQEMRELTERNESVENVAMQLKQLEELVQELEEGLEDARRGEVEARGEVEFLRGEVERTRSELRREREKSMGNVAVKVNNDYESVKELEKRDEEIRGLKKIIHSLSLDSFPDLIKSDLARISTQSRPILAEGNELLRARFDYEKKQEVSDQSPYSETPKTTYSSEDHDRDLERLRRESLGAPSASTATHPYSSSRDSRGTIVSIRQNDSHTMHQSKPSLISAPEHLAETDNYSSTNESFCELCETPGHDILVCTNVFTTDSQRRPRKISIPEHSVMPPVEIPAPLASSKASVIQAGQILALPLDNGPIAGKESKIVDPEKWCAICEHEGHESIDCPSEDSV